jgi:hypothetical protein
MLYYAVFTYFLYYFLVAVLVKMPRMVLTSAELSTGTCTGLICPCQSNFVFKMIIHAIICRFTSTFKLFPCGRVGGGAGGGAGWCWAGCRRMYGFGLPMPE